VIRWRKRGLRDQAACQQAIDRLGLTEPFSLDGIHAAVERHLGAPIRLVRAPHMPDGTSGLWLAYPDHHVIVIMGDPGPLGEAVTRLHEYGHMVFGDRTAIALPDTPAQLFPDLDPDLVAAALRRSHFDERIEQRAETFATVALPGTDLLAASAHAAADADPDVLARLKDALER
jgi:hypothetical protein